MQSTRSFTRTDGPPVLMRVDLYSPDQLYGFTEAEGLSVYFHLGSFVAGHWEGMDIAPPPILGEEVQVVFDSSTMSNKKAPRASSVTRLARPIFVQGVVESFNPGTGWGFAGDSAGQSYYLHRSEVEGGRLPLPGQQVSFFRGFKRGRPRACHVKVGSIVG